MTYLEALYVVDYWHRRKLFYEEVTGQEYPRTYLDDRPKLLKMKDQIVFNERIGK